MREAQSENRVSDPRISLTHAEAASKLRNQQEQMLNRGGRQSRLWGDNNQEVGFMSSSSSSCSSSSSSSSGQVGPGLCYYQWDMHTRVWSPIPGQIFCSPGYYAQPPAIPGTYDGEVRNGTCKYL